MLASRANVLSAKPGPLRRTVSVGQPSRTRSVAVCVKPTKAADFQGLSNDEIMNKIGDLKIELTSTRFLYRTRGISEMSAGDSQPQPDPEKMPRPDTPKYLRRQVAQLWTIWRQRQIKEGVDARTSRKQLAAQVRSGWNSI